MRLVVLALVLAPPQLAAHALTFSEPDAVYYGSVFGGGANVEISARVGDDVLAAFRTGRNPAAPGLDILRIPLLPRRATVAHTSGYAQVGNRVDIYVDTARAGDVAIASRGQIQLLNITLGSDGVPVIEMPPTASPPPGGLPGTPGAAATPTPQATSTRAAAVTPTAQVVAATATASPTATPTPIPCVDGDVATIRTIFRRRTNCLHCRCVPIPLRVAQAQTALLNELPGVSAWKADEA